MKLSLLIVAALASSCSLEVSYEASRFVCSRDEDCPSLQACGSDGYCSRPNVVDSPDAAASDGDAAELAVDAAARVDGAIDGGVTSAVCGDGMLGGSEQCDDGNQLDSDGCVACAFARCGDGKTRLGVESCDDGNTADNDACNSACAACVNGNARYFRAANGHCYFRVNQPIHWYDAEYGCASRDAHLLSYSGQAEKDEVFANLSLSTINLAWIGLEQQSDTTWVWATGEPSTGFTSWAAGEPSGSGTCVAQNTSSSNWQSEPCASTYLSYLCEDDGWIRRPEDNHAYRVMYLWENATTAAAACTERKAHLVTYESDAERAFVAGLVHGRGRYWQGPAVDCKAVTFDSDGPPYATETVSCTVTMPWICEID